MGTSQNVTPNSNAHNDNLAARLAAFFLAHPNEWLDGRELAEVAGLYGWRTRVSDVRRRPYNLNVENRQRRLRRSDGTPYTVSEYRLLETA